jgi:hypothetical protein
MVQAARTDTGSNVAELNDGREASNLVRLLGAA